MSDKNQNWQEIGILWPAKKVSAAGVVTTAAATIIEPGASLVIQKIEYPNGKPEKAPSSRVMLVIDTPTRVSGGNNQGAPDDDIPF